MRRILLVILIAAVGACSDSSGPDGSPADAFALRTIDGVPLPVQVDEDDEGVVHLTASTLHLSADGTFEAVATFLRTPGGDRATWTTMDSGTWEWSEDDLLLEFADGTSDRATLEGGDLVVESGESLFDHERIEAPFALVEAYAFPELGTGFLRAFDFTGDGALWAVASDGSILRRHGGQATTWDAVADLGGTAAADLFVDPDDRVWVALGNGFAVYEQGAWTRHEPPVQLPTATALRRVVVDTDGDVLLAAGVFGDGGVLVRHEGAWAELTPENSTLPQHITHDVTADPAGGFWVGSTPSLGRGGLARIVDGAVERVYDQASGLLADGADAVGAGASAIAIGWGHPIRDDWAGADGGIQLLDPVTGELTAFYPASSGLASSRVGGLLVTDDGSVWFRLSLDEARPTCVTCYVGVGRMLGDGSFEIVSALNSGLEANAYLQGPVEGPDGSVYVATDRTVFRVVR